MQTELIDGQDNAKILELKRLKKKLFGFFEEHGFVCNLKDRDDTRFRNRRNIVLTVGVSGNGWRFWKNWRLMFSYEYDTNNRAEEYEIVKSALSHFDSNKDTILNGALVERNKRKGCKSMKSYIEKL